MNKQKLLAGENSRVTSKNGVALGLQHMLAFEKTFFGRLLHGLHKSGQPTIHQVYNHLKNNAGPFVKKIQLEGQALILKLRHAGERKARIVRLVLADFKKMVKLAISNHAIGKPATA